MSTVYVIVATENKLPPTEEHSPYWKGYVILEDGNIHPALFKADEGNSFPSHPNGKVTHYLKEVELPSEEEIHVQSHKYSDSFDEQTAFRDGQRHILNLLNPTHNEQ